MPEEGDSYRKRKKLIETCVRLFPEDMETIQGSEELQVGQLCRDLLHNFLKFNGYSQMDLMQEIHNIEEDINKLTTKKIGLEHQLQAMLNQRFDQEEKALVEERRILYIAKLKYMWAEQLYIAKKSASYQGKQRTQSEDIEWVKTRLLGVKEIKDYSEPPEQVLDELNDMIKGYSEDFDKKFDAEYTRGGHHRGKGR